MAGSPSEVFAHPHIPTVAVAGSHALPHGRKAGAGAGGNRIVLEVDDLPTHVEGMKKAGLRFPQRDREESRRQGKSDPEDPDGNPIELFEPAR